MLSDGAYWDGATGIPARAIPPQSWLAPHSNRLTETALALRQTWWAGLDLNQLTPKRTDLQSAAPHRLRRLPKILGTQWAILPSGTSIHSRVLAVVPNFGWLGWARTNDILINSQVFIPTELLANKLGEAGGERFGNTGRSTCLIRRQFIQVSGCYCGGSML